ncbi:MAG: glycosyltransferase 87 family protein [Chloroflexota bacterium]
MGGRWRLYGLAILAAIGGVLLAAIVMYFWSKPNDALAYWLAGENLVAGRPIYLTGEDAFQPYAYHYVPAVAQLFAPLTLVIPTIGYLIAYRAIELLVTWQLAGRRMLPMLALIAFLPVAVELSTENVHLLMALGVVLGLSRWPWLFTVGAIVKISPGLGLVYLAVQRRWRDLAISIVVGGVIVGVSFAMDPALWQAWFDTVVGRVGVTGNSLIPVPYIVRALAGLAMAVAGGLLGRRPGELLLVGAVTIANPNLSMNGFAVLAAMVPIWRAGPDGLAARRTPSGREGAA